MLKSCLQSEFFNLCRSTLPLEHLYSTYCKVEKRALALMFSPSGLDGDSVHERVPVTKTQVWHKAHTTPQTRVLNFHGMFHLRKSEIKWVTSILSDGKNRHVSQPVLSTNGAITNRATPTDLLPQPAQVSADRSRPVPSGSKTPGLQCERHPALWLRYYVQRRKKYSLFREDVLLYIHLSDFNWYSGVEIQV